uniref:CNOT1_CAF1_bind domain-containing protein n=1 Tax=Panagrellus redivivus TaxID=6233 RepID=A0A7E4VZL9_PANRE
MGNPVPNEHHSLHASSTKPTPKPKSVRESSTRSSYGFGPPRPGQPQRPSSLTLNCQRRPPRATMDFRPDFARPPPMAMPGNARHHDAEVVVDVDPRLDEKLLEDIIFLFNNLAGSNVVEKALELRTVFCHGSPSLLIKFVRYFVQKRVCLEPNNHILYLQLLHVVGSNLVDYVRENAIQQILNYVSDPSRSTIPDKSAFKALGNWIGLTTYGIGKPLDLVKLDLNKILQKCNTATIVSTLPMVCKLLAHLNDKAQFESPDIQRVFIHLKHLHSDPEISMNLKFEIEALFAELRERQAKNAPPAPVAVKQSERLAPYQVPYPPSSQVSSETLSVADKKPEEIEERDAGLLDANAEEYAQRFDAFEIVIRPALGFYSPKFFKLLVVHSVRMMVDKSIKAAKEVADGKLGRLVSLKKDLAEFEETIEKALLRPIAQAMFPNMNQETFKLNLSQYLKEYVSKSFGDALTPAKIDYIATALTEDNIHKALEYISNESCKLAFGMIQDLVKMTIMRQRSNASRQSPPVMYGSYLTPVSPFDMLSMSESHPCASIPQMHYPTVANPPPGHDRAAYPSPPSPSSAAQSLLHRPLPRHPAESYEQCFQPQPPPPPRIEVSPLCEEIIVYLREVIHPLFKTPVKPAILQSYHDLESALNSFLSLPIKTANQVAILVDKTVYMFLTAFTEPPLPSHQDKSTFCSVFFHLIAILRNHVDKSIVSNGATRVVIEAVKTGRFNQEALMIMIKKGVILCDRIDNYVVQQIQDNDTSAILFARHMHRAYGTSNVDQFSSTFPGIYRQLISALREY